jgi:NADH dehydrogenase [ubiquinone] 1 alpha subcomplex assembly factor 1
MKMIRAFITASIQPLMAFICFVAFALMTPVLHGKDHQLMKTLFDFTGEKPDVEWRSSNDGVMGGLSKGSARILEEGMLFNGELSIENNGGFSLIYFNANFDLSDFSGIRLTVLGDGRIYQLRLESDAIFSQRGPVNFSSEFKTTVGEWVEVFLPFSDLNQSWRGRQLSGYTFNVQDIRRIGIMLADKRSGEFSLKIESIVAQ